MLLFSRFTKQGNLKYETECAPNNGYYFIPLYDKGNYIIKVFITFAFAKMFDIYIFGQFRSFSSYELYSYIKYSLVIEYVYDCVRVYVYILYII